MISQNRNEVKLREPVLYNGKAVLKVLSMVIGETEQDTSYKCILEDGTLADVPFVLIDAARGV